MMEVLLVYLWLKLDAVQSLTFVSSIVGGMIFLLVWGVSSEYYSESRPPKKLGVIASVLLFISLVIPNSSQMAILVGTHYAVAFKDSLEGQKVMTLIRKKANEYLDAELKATEPKKEK